jgi:hypothetical protein
VGLAVTHYISAWLPGVVCTFVAWLIGWRQGVFTARVAARRDQVMDKLLRDAERAGVIDLALDGEGRIKGGSIKTAEIIPLSRNVVVLRTHARPH